MGRTVTSITQTFLRERAAFARFRRALRQGDQQVLDDLFASAQKHLSAASYASHALPFETFLLAMLLEEHKHVLRLQTRLEYLYRSRGMGEQWDELFTPPGEPAPFTALPQITDGDWDDLLPDRTAEDQPPAGFQPPDAHAGQGRGAEPGKAG